MFLLSPLSSRYKQPARRARTAPPPLETLEPRTHLAAHIGMMTYPTIQAAVLAALPGQTITVDPGVYNESVVIPAAKPMIKILGAQAGVDARTRPGAPASESIVQGPAGATAFTVGASDVTIDGFTVQNATNPNAFGAGIYIQPGQAGTRIYDNIIQQNIVGLFVDNDSATDPAEVKRNLFRDNTQPGPASGTDIYADEFTAGGTATNVIIQSNLFTNSTFVEDSWGVGISNTATLPFTNFQILDNTFRNGGRGMYFFGTADSTIQRNNVIGATHYGIGFFGGDDGFSITCNNILRNGTGILVEDDLGSPNMNIEAHQNNIAGNTDAGLRLSNEGVTPVAYVGVLDATCNWWGSSTGPRNPRNPCGRGDKVVEDPGAGSVDFCPWLTSPSTCAPSMQSDDGSCGCRCGDGEERNGHRERKNHDDVYESHHHDDDD